MNVVLQHRRPLGWATVVTFLVGVFLMTAVQLLALVGPQSSSLDGVATADSTGYILTDRQASRVEGAGINWGAVAVGAACAAVVLGAVVFTGGAAVVAYAAVSTTVTATTGFSLIDAGAASVVGGLMVLDEL